MKKFGHTRKILIMGIICLILTFAIRNWTEKRIAFYLGQINSGLERIAQVKTITNDVTRNHTGQLLWQGIDSGEVIFIGNSVQTEKESATEIIFDDGEQITLGPESLVRFVRSENKILMQMITGKAEIKTSDAEIQKTLGLPQAHPKRLFLATPKGRVVLNNSDIRIEAKQSDPENFKIEVLKGAPELIRNGKIEILKISDITERIEVVPELKKTVSLPRPLLPQTVPLPVSEPVVTAPTAALESAVTAPAATSAEPAPAPAEKAVAETEPPRKPAAAPLKAPKVKSIKVEADE